MWDGVTGWGNDPSLRAVTRDLVGRNDECRRLLAFLDDARPGPSASVVAGPPGAGKTALFEYTVAEAVGRRLRVVTASPAAAEAALPYAALVDLFAQLDDRLVDDLPAAQRVALRAALSNEADVDRAHETHAVARGVLAVLRNAAPEVPLLLAIDDAQWVDPSSTRALLFALRRVGDAHVRLLVTHRALEAEAWRETIERTVPDDRRTILRLGPLDVDETAALLESRLGLRLPRPGVVEVHRRSEGNPLFALELGRRLVHGHASNQPGSGKRQSASLLRTIEWTSLADDLSTLLEARLGQLSEEGRSAVLAAAAASHPGRDLLDRMHGSSATNDAIRNGVLRADGNRIRFVHPLFASVAYATAPAEARRAIHLMLADLVEDEDEVALHRARGSAEPSEDVALFLDAAAARAALRGAPEIAAELSEHAARLSPEHDVERRRSRLVSAGDHHLAAGDPDRARQIFEELLPTLQPGRARADVLWRLADAVGDDLPLSVRLSEQALAEADGASELQATIRLALGTFTWLAGDLAASLTHVREAARLAATTGNNQLLAISLGEVLHAEAVLGLATDPSVAERAMDLEREVETFPPGTRPSFQLAIVYVYTDRPDDARPLLEAELKRVTMSGDENARVAVLFRISELELRAGNWGRALRAASESAALAAQAGIEQEQCVALTSLSAVTAHLGRIDDASAPAERALAIAMGSGDRMSVLRARAVLGFIALSRGDAKVAHEWLAPAMADIEAAQIGELSISGVVQNELDALIRLGMLEDAERVIEHIERKSGQPPRAWHAAVAARARALVSAARGDDEAAQRWIAAALDAHDRLPQPFERGRTLLAAGTIDRRQRRRAIARAHITEALEIFDTLGAALWAEAAATELARISGRTPSLGALTETERRTASLVAEGLSNAEIAARMFVTVRTVEAHLSRIYSKLNLRSRVDVARWAGAQRNLPDS